MDDSCFSLIFYRPQNKKITLKYNIGEYDWFYLIHVFLGVYRSKMLVNSLVSFDEKLFRRLKKVDFVFLQREVPIWIMYFIICYIT